jgi:hypothetical protein
LHENGDAEKYDYDDESSGLRNSSQPGEDSFQDPSTNACLLEQRGSSRKRIPSAVVISAAKTEAVIAASRGSRGKTNKPTRGRGRTAVAASALMGGGRGRGRGRALSSFRPPLISSVDGRPEMRQNMPLAVSSDLPDNDTLFTANYKVESSSEVRKTSLSLIRQAACTCLLYLAAANRMCHDLLLFR